LAESPADILPDPENPVQGLLRRGVGFCGGLFLVIGFMSFIWGMEAISPAVGAQYVTQGAIALVLGLILVVIQLRLEK